MSAAPAARRGPRRRNNFKPPDVSELPGAQWDLRLGEVPEGIALEEGEQQWSKDRLVGITSLSLEGVVLAVRIPESIVATDDDIYATLPGTVAKATTPKTAVLKSWTLTFDVLTSTDPASDADEIELVKDRVLLRPDGTIAFVESRGESVQPPSEGGGTALLNLRWHRVVLAVTAEGGILGAHGDVQLRRVRPEE